MINIDQAMNGQDVEFLGNICFLSTVPFCCHFNRKYFVDSAVNLFKRIDIYNTYGA